MLHLKLLEKQEQAKPKTSRRRQIIKIRIEINEIETEKTIQRINKTKSWPFEKLNKIDKLLANLMKMGKQMTQTNKVTNKKGEITANTKKIQGINRIPFENLYSNTLENLEEMDKFLETYNHPKLYQEDVNHLNRSITCNEIEAAIDFLQKENAKT
jgi:hypothetical protein